MIAAGWPAYSYRVFWDHVPHAPWADQRKAGFTHAQLQKAKADEFGTAPPGSTDDWKDLGCYGKALHDTYRDYPLGTE